MKTFKILSIGFVLFSLGFTANAQTEQGHLLIGGESKLNFTSLNSKWKTDDDSGDVGKTTNLDFSPQIGFFVADGLALGIEIPISYSSEKDEDENKYNSTSMAFAPFLKYYFGSGNIKPYFQGEFGIGNLNMKYEPASGTSDDASAGMFLYQVGGGIGVFLNEKVSLDFGLGYSSVSIKPDEDNDINYQNISSGFGLGIGIVVIL